MIRNLELFRMVNGRLDYSEVDFRHESSPELSCKKPDSIDIKLSCVNIRYFGDRYSFVRPYKFEKVYPAVRVFTNRYQEKIVKRSYRIYFNNPHEKENECSGVVVLNWFQNVKFFLYRFINWFRGKDNLLWATNILVIITNIIILLISHGNH